MNTREFLIECFKSERPKFERVLRAVPSDKLAYRPHERSSCAGDIVWLLASELHDACVIVDRGELDFVLPPAPATLDEAIATYERNASELQERLSRLDDAAWGKPARFLVDGKVAWEAPLGEMLWGFLFDAIHHRGQLSAYLRPMGAKVPSIYGPSADAPGA
jgi:DinB family